MGVKAFVHGGMVTLPTELRIPPSLTLRTARYDKTAAAYVPVDVGGTLTLPLAEEEHIAVSGNVGCRTTGLMCVFLVIATKGKLTIGRLDIANSTYEVTGEIEGDGDESCLECWLVDGPTVVAWYRSKVVVASERQEHSVPYIALEGSGFPKWKGDMLERSFQRVFVDGNQVLCVSSSSELVRSVDVLSFSLPSGSSVGRYAPTLSRVEIPAELDPCLITCVAFVRSEFALSYSIVFGTSDGRLKCCYQTEVMVEVSLEESPLSVVIAESAHGVPVLVVSLGGMDRKVVTLFADSLRHINSWTGIHQVIVDDLAMFGDAQMLLITHPSPSSAFSFEHCLRVSLLEPGSSPTSASAAERHRIPLLNSITAALEARLHEGVTELHAAEQRRQDKMRMLTAACNLLPAVAARAAGVPSDAVQLVSVPVPALYSGRCFLILDVHVTPTVLPAGVHFRRPTLFATSLRGFVKTKASELPSPANANRLRFLVSFLLKDCNFPLHIIFAAEVHAADPTDGPFVGAKNKIYTQWIHSVEDLAVAAAAPSQTPGSSGDAAAACEKWVAGMGEAVSRDEFQALVKAVVLQTSPGNYTWSTRKGSRAREDHAKAPLTSMYVQDMARVSGSSNVGEALEDLYAPRLVEMASRCAEGMVEEIQRCTNEDSADAQLAEVQAETDRRFCQLLASIMYNSFGELEVEEG